MLYVIDAKHNLKPGAERVPTADHWQLYRRAVTEHADIVDAMYATIREIVDSEQYMNANREFPNSSWLGSRILRDWSHRNRWNSLYPDVNVSSALFGQIMWTVMYDHPREWCTTLTTGAHPERDNRVYWLHNPTPG